MDNLNLEALTVGPSLAFLHDFSCKLDLYDNISPVYNGLDYCTIKKIDVAPWCYIFRRKFWLDNNFQFYPGISYEDSQLIPYVVSKVLRISTLTRFSCYNYIQREGSTMNSRPNKHKILSSVVLINTHIEYANEMKNSIWRNFFLKSASSSFIDAINNLIRMRADRATMNEFLSAIMIRPTLLYGPGFVQKIYQYLILHFPRLFIKVARLFK